MLPNLTGGGQIRWGCQIRHDSAFKFVAQVVYILRNRRSSIANHRSTIARCRTSAGFMLPSRSLQVSILLSTFSTSLSKTLIATVAVWKLIFNAPSIGLSKGDEQGEVNCNFQLELRRVCARRLGERSRGFALYLYPDMQGIVPKGLQKPGVRGVSYRRRKATVSHMTSTDVIRGAASFSMTSIGVIRGQRVKLSPACTKNACVTWHPAPSPPQHPDAVTCPIPDTLSTNEPNSNTCNTVHVGDRLSYNLMSLRFELPSLHILHVRCQFCVIRAVEETFSFCMFEYVCAKNQ